MRHTQTLLLALIAFSLVSLPPCGGLSLTRGRCPVTRLEPRIQPPTGFGLEVFVAKNECESTLPLFPVNQKTHAPNLLIPHGLVNLPHQPDRFWCNPPPPRRTPPTNSALTLLPACLSPCANARPTRSTCRFRAIVARCDAQRKTITTLRQVSHFFFDLWLVVLAFVFFAADFCGLFAARAFSISLRSRCFADFHRRSRS